MVLEMIHYVPAAAAGVLTIYIAVMGNRGTHRLVAYVAAVLAAVGLYGFFTEDPNTLLVPGFHAIHGWVGVGALVLFLDNLALRGKKGWSHCYLGRAAGVLAAVSLAMGVMILLGYVPLVAQPAVSGQFPVSSKLPGVEASTYMNASLTPISKQLNNAIIGTQYIDRNTYRLRVSGLVDRDMTLTYSDIIALPAYAEVSPLNCVEGWSFTAKWTGFRVTDLLNQAGVKPDGQYVLFTCSDNYTTALPLSYLEKNQTLLAYGLNDVTLPPDRGFPLQLVAMSKYGYKWAKWVVEIDVISGPKLGYWESRGYSDSADVGAYPYS